MKKADVCVKLYSYFPLPAAVLLALLWFQVRGEDATAIFLIFFSESDLDFHTVIVRRFSSVHSYIHL